MRVTRAEVEQYAIAHGFEPIQLDGIPEGFSWKAPDITIGDKTHYGWYVGFIPLADSLELLEHPTTEDLLKDYDNKLWQQKKLRAGMKPVYRLKED